METGERLVADGRQAAEAHQAALSEALRDAIEITSAVIPGNLVTVLCSEAERLNADIIVVGSVRTQGVGRMLGSVASDVLKQTPCAVYVSQDHLSQST